MAGGSRMNVLIDLLEQGTYRLSSSRFCPAFQDLALESASGSGKYSAVVRKIQMLPFGDISRSGGCLGGAKSNGVRGLGRELQAG